MRMALAPMLRADAHVCSLAPMLLAGKKGGTMVTMAVPRELTWVTLVRVAMANGWVTQKRERGHRGENKNQAHDEHIRGFAGGDGMRNDETRTKNGLEWKGVTVEYNQAHDGADRRCRCRWWW
jgi:hypothetical protein